MPQAQLYYTPGVDISQPLVDDKSGSGRPQPWAEHRGAADLLAYAYDDLDQRKAARLRNCAPRLLYEQRSPAAAGAAPGLKLHTAWFCRVRLCPVCQWRRSLKIYGQATEVIRAAQQTAPPEGYAWLMLTLTVRNVDGWALKAELSRVLTAWHRLQKLRDWQAVVLGSMRSIEVTHNLQMGGGQYDTYHPHIHALLCVSERYFSSRHYLSRAAWQRLWRAAARLDYDPQVWVTRVKGDSAAALAEVAKYSAKPGDYVLPDDLDMMALSVATLDAALDRRRLVAWAGNLKTIHAALGLDDAEDGDLIHTDQEPDTGPEAEQTTLTAYDWLPGYRQYYRETQPVIVTDGGASHGKSKAGPRRAGAGKTNR